MPFLKKYKISDDRIIVIIIIVLASVLRLYNFWNLPFMHDEFSAIIRSQYDNFSDLIDFGVKTDSHPAGVQIFIYYWIKIFGLHEWSLKFPFIICGIFSVFLVYKIAKTWFGSDTAVFSALTIGILQFTIFYSQLARPYSPGLCFVLLSTFYWTKLVFQKEYSKVNIILYVMAASIASYIHAFSLFFIFIQGITGLFFIKGKANFKYIFINSLIFILYIPHIQIFIIQMQRGDIGGWLAKPNINFILDFFSYAFHYSQIFYFTVIASVYFLSTSSKNRKKGVNKFRLISLLWFTITFLTAYLYSVYRHPILQFSTLLFVFPFIIMLAFSYVANLKTNIKYIFMLGFTLVGVFTLVTTRQHYNTMYNQGFDGIVKNIAKDSKKYNIANPSFVLQAPNQKMFEYYLEKNNLDNSYFKITDGKLSTSLHNFINNKKPKVLFYGWADYEDLSIVAYLKDNYKYILNKESFFNSEYFVFSDTLIDENISKDIENKHEIVGSSNEFIFNSNKPGFSKPLEIQTDSLNLNKFSVFNIVATINKMQANTNALLVMDLLDSEGKSIWWSSSKINSFYLDSTKNKVYHSKRIYENYPISKGSILKAYIWKQDSSFLQVRDIQFYVSHIQPVEFGLYKSLTP